MSPVSPLRRFIASVLAIAMLAAAGCGEDREPVDAPPLAAPIERSAENARRPPITIGSKGFTEQFLLAEIYAQALTAAGYRTTTRLGLGDERDALTALQRGEIQAYPEYTGTALSALFDVPLDEIPKDEQRAFEQARAAFAERGLVALPYAPVSNANGFAMRLEDATALGITRLSSLERLNDRLVLSGPPECANRPDCKQGLEDTYGLRFKSFLAVPASDRHKPLADGKADVGLVFTTDGQIYTENLVVLEDDEGLLPPYNVTLVVDEGAARAAGPDLRRVVARVQRGLTTRVMQELNARVDLDGESPQAIAAQYLRATGLEEDPR